MDGIQSRQVFLSLLLANAEINGGRGPAGRGRMW
jgi:hypothetical protein